MFQRDRPYTRSAIRAVSLDSGWLVYDCERDVVHRLNPTAALILTLCDGNHTVQQIEAALVLAQNGQPDADPAAEVQAWLSQAAEDGLIAVNGPPAYGPAEMSVGELARLAERLHEQGEVRDAYQCQCRATQLEPDNSDLWYSLGELAHALGDLQGSREAYQRYLSYEPDDAEVAHLITALGNEPAPARPPETSVLQTFDGFAESYDETMLDELGYRAPQLIVDCLRQTLPPPQASLNVADLGCGTGLAAPHLKPWARRLVGIDLSPQMASYACATGHYQEIHVAELVAWLSGVREPFDLMVACDVFIYFGDLTDVLQAAGRALVPGGQLGFSLERGQGEDYQLTESGRYAHSRSYVEQVSAAAGFSWMHISQAVIRTEYGRPVVGLLVVLRKEPPVAAAEDRLP